MALQISDNEDEIQSNLSSDSYLTFIFKPEDKISDIAFENMLSVLKKFKLKLEGNLLFYQFDEPASCCLSLNK